MSHLDSHGGHVLGRIHLDSVRCLNPAEQTNLFGLGSTAPGAPSTSSEGVTGPCKPTPNTWSLESWSPRKLEQHSVSTGPCFRDMATTLGKPSVAFAAFLIHQLHPNKLGCCRLVVLHPAIEESSVLQCVTLLKNIEESHNARVYMGRNLLFIFPTFQSLRSSHPSRSYVLAPRPEQMPNKLQGKYVVRPAPSTVRGIFCSVATPGLYTSQSCGRSFHPFDLPFDHSMG